ncbi:unnamed protein product [Camellia sinensis]
MAKEFNVPPVVFPSGGNPGTAAQQRRLPTPPFQPPRSANPNIPFMSFDIGSVSAASTSFSAPQFGGNMAGMGIGTGFEDEPPLLEELGINTRQIWSKTVSIANPFRVNANLHEDADLSGPFLFVMAFGLFQLLAGKLHFGILLGWVTVSALFLYIVFNMLAGRNGNLDLYRCVSLIGYCMLPMVILSAIGLFLPQGGAAIFVIAGVFVVWSTRVCTRLLVELASCGDEHRGLIASYSCTNSNDSAVFTVLLITCSVKCSSGVKTLEALLLVSWKTSQKGKIKINVDDCYLGEYVQLGSVGLKAGTGAATSVQCSLSLSLAMAGTLQTLSFRPGSAGTLPYRPRIPHSPAIHAGLLFGHTFNSSPTPLLLRKTHSISSPIRANHHSDQVRGNGNQSSKVPGSAAASILARKLLTFASNNFLPLALVGGVLFGLVNPSLGCLADRYYMSKFSTFGIFIISGLTLRSEEIGAAAEAWPVGIFGLGSILLLTPLFSRFILQLQLQPQEFVTGLAIFSCMPTTLSSGVALTRVPFSISVLIANGVGVSVPTKQLFRNLVLTLLVPLLLGKVFRESFKGLVPWIQVSRSSSMLLMVKPAVFLVAVGMGPQTDRIVVSCCRLLHLSLLAFNALAIQGLSTVSGGSKSMFAKRENAVALLLVASQKTLPVMVAVVEQLGGALGESGLLVLPCVAAHLNQIVMDSFLINFWVQKEQSAKYFRVLQRAS